MKEIHSMIKQFCNLTDSGYMVNIDFYCIIMDIIGKRRQRIYNGNMCVRIDIFDDTRIEFDDYLEKHPDLLIKIEQALLEKI